MFGDGTFVLVGYLYGTVSCTVCYSRLSGSRRDFEFSMFIRYNSSKHGKDRAPTPGFLWPGRSLPDGAWETGPGNVG